MPANQRLGLYDYQGRAPIEESGDKRKWRLRGGIDASGLNATFSVEPQLSAKKKVLGFDR